MEHVFGRYVECPYSTRTLFFNKNCDPINIKSQINPYALSLYIEPIIGLENYLYYDPICGKDKVITVGDTFSNGDKLTKHSYIPCTSLIYYLHDIIDNGERELNFAKMDSITCTVISETCIENSNLNLNYVPDHTITKFIDCFTNFNGKDSMRKLLRDFGWIYRKDGNSKKILEFTSQKWRIWNTNAQGRREVLIDSIYY